MMLSRSSNDIVADDERNIIVVQLAEYGDVREVSDDGITRYRETFQSMKMADRVAAKDAHGGSIIGHADIQSFRDRPNPTVDLHIADTTAGRDLMALVRNGTVDSVSVEFIPSDKDTEDDGVVVRNDALVSAVAFAHRPAHQAPILATREDNTPQTKETNMADTATPDIAAEAVTRTDLDGIVDELKRELVAYAPATVANPHSDFLKFRSFGEFSQSVANGDTDSKLLTRALFDQVTGANPGLIPQGWVSQVFGIIDRGRRTVTAFGATGLPGSGMDINWPYFDGDLTAIVATQATQKTAVNSVAVSIKKGSANIATYAGGSDISYQLIRRSDPSYLDSYMRIMALAYAAETDAAANAQALAAATEGPAWNPASDDADALRAALFESSIAVENATGQPASFAVVASDVFLAIGSLADLWPTMYGTSNVAGTADAASLNVTVSGLPILHDPYAAAGSFIVSNSAAGAWAEEGPMTVSAEDVELLGQNVAVWGMGVFTPYLPAGIIEIPATATP